MIYGVQVVTSSWCTSGNGYQPANDNTTKRVNLPFSVNTGFLNHRTKPRTSGITVGNAAGFHHSPTIGRLTRQTNRNSPLEMLCGKCFRQPLKRVKLGKG